MSIRNLAACITLVGGFLLAGCGSTGKSVDSSRSSVASLAEPAGAITETTMAGVEGGGVFRVWEIGRELPTDARLMSLTFIHSGRIDGVIATVSIHGREWESPRFGVGEVGRKFQRTVVDFAADEQLISFDVFMSKLTNGAPAITKLTVRTSKQVVDVGEKTGDFHGTALCPPGRRVVGVCGRAGWFLDAIGLQTVKK